MLILCRVKYDLVKNISFSLGSSLLVTSTQSFTKSGIIFSNLIGISTFSNVRFLSLSSLWTLMKSVSSILGTPWYLSRASRVIISISPDLSNTAVGFVFLVGPPHRKMAGSPNDNDSNGASLLGSEWSVCPPKLACGG